MRRRRPAKTVYERRVGLRWGRLLTGLQAARIGLQVAYGEKSLLPRRITDELLDVYNRLKGVEQESWTQESKDAEFHGPKETR